MIGNLINLFGSLIVFFIGLFTLIKIKDKLPIKMTNIIFVFIIFIPYIILFSFCYILIGGNDPNFIMCLPIGNVSPCMFTLSVISLLPLKKVKNIIYTLYVYLIVGMILAGPLSDIGYMVQGTPYNVFRTLDTISHIFLALFAVYLVISGQVEVSKKSFLNACITIYLIVTFIIMLNAIFDTSFFGLNLNGKHNIYLLVLTSNSYLSLLLYLIGLFGVLITSYFMEKILYKKILKIDI